MAKRASESQGELFPKSALLYSERFQENRDLVDALLDDDGQYTIEEVTQKIENYMKGKVV